MGSLQFLNCYNQTKAGVDTLDQVIRFYSVRRRTRRWPLVIFYNILDIACYNALQIFTLKYKEFKLKHGKRPRRTFISDLTDGILEKYKTYIIDKSIPEPKVTKFEKKGSKRCFFCPRTKDCKPSSGCDSCKKPACKSNLFNFCKYCSK